jgi:1,4-alpha-glucan branching enzyme
MMTTTTKRPVISVVLNAHTPFVHQAANGESHEEHWFFESLSETYLPLLEMFDRLDADHVPFRIALCVSPILCHLLKDRSLIARYLANTDRRIAFGEQEIGRTGGDPALQRLARRCYDTVLDRRINFTERYESNILNVFEHYQRKGRLELISTAATHAFLPFYAARPEALQAQLEVAIAAYRRAFVGGAHTAIRRNESRFQGFWLPELGWDPELEGLLRAYNFGYTIVDTHAFALGDPAASLGSFYPARTPHGILLLARDHYAYQDIVAPERGFAHDAAYRDNRWDAGYELPADMMYPFRGLPRVPTGYKYYAHGSSHSRDGKKPLYDPEQAAARAREQAALFLERRVERLTAALSYTDKAAISVCAYNADVFGRLWHEGTRFLESLFREGHEKVQFMTPAEYLFKQDVADFEVLSPEYSSAGVNGYAETWLDASNDWMYRHVARSLERMTELAERFPDESGIKERLLNQAAREILLAQMSDWAKMLYTRESAEYARAQIEACLRNFTTIYEALASNYISTEWLTTLERRHNLFPYINYRVFRRKQ